VTPVLADATALEFSLAAATRVAGDVDGDGQLTCADAALVRNALGTRLGDKGYDARADLNGDRVISGLDVSTIMKLNPRVVAECANR
jgi:hypothetical protein